MSWRKMLEQVIVSESPRCTKECFEWVNERKRLAGVPLPLEGEVR